MIKNNCYITNELINPEHLEATLDDPSCGGVVTFVGKVRNHHDGWQVTSLTYEAYIPMAEKIFAQIAAEAAQKSGAKEVRIVHRVGDLQISDVAVWVGVQSPHRAEAFAACRYAIDELKQRAPIWKKEHYADSGSEWVACHQEVKTAVILAGGQSRRFGSDKLFAELNGKTLVETLIETLKHCGFQIFISGPKNKFGHLGLPVIEDEHPYEGPLCALSGVWKKTTADRILVVAGDMPFIGPAVVDELWKKGQMTDVTILRNTRGPSPLPGVYSRRTRKTIVPLLKEGRRDLFSLLDKGLLVEIIDKNKFTGNEAEQSLVNINTTNDLNSLI